MTALPPDALADLYRLVAELEQRLESSFAAHDDAIARQAGAAEEIAQLRAELGITRDRQSASVDILNTIADGSGDAEGSLYRIAETTKRLFAAQSVTIQIAEGDGWSQTIRVGDTSKRIGEAVPIALLKVGGRNMPGTVVADNRQIHVPDLDNVDPEIADWPGLPLARAAGTRTMCGTPLRREGKAIGVLIVFRNQFLPFTDEELALQQSFANQAAIAIENARLFSESQEALERQTATADILKVIASSPSDVQPVFDAIVNSAATLFQPCAATITTLKDGKLHWNAVAELVPSFDHKAAEASYPIPFDPARAPSARAVLERRIIEIPDTEAPDTPEITRKIAGDGGFRSITFVPLVLEGKGVGTIILTHPTVGFRHSDKQLALIQTFADQAVIAIENARLFNETQEALERQTATAEILKVIASSPSDARPAFEAIAISANRLLGGFSAAVFRFIDNTVHLAAFTPVGPAADAALRADFPQPVDNFEGFQLAQHGKPLPIADTEAINAPVREIARLHGFRSMLFVPMMYGGVPVGIISVTRRETGAFSPNHMQLLQTFADQAVIAIENTRLFTETQEALERQTATAEVLKVISRSVFDLQTVFDTLVESAYKLCGAGLGLLYLRTSDAFECKAIAGSGVAEARHLFMGRPIRAGRGTAAERVILTGEVHSITDFFTDPEVDPRVREMIRNGASADSSVGQLRSTLAVPMTRDDAVIGVLVIARPQTGPFPTRQVELLQTFADQAVIAIENARLFDEVQAKTADLTEALTYQTGSSNILRVIASSPTDVGPVLKAIVENAAELCDAYDAALLLKDGGDLRFSAHQGSIPIGIEKWPINRHWTAGRAFLDQKPVHLHDLLADENEDFSDGRELSRRMGHRSILSVPLLHEKESIGAIVLRRTEVHPFSDKQVALLQTFADQAVIAIGNVRLFEEVQAKTRDLSEALTYQTGSSNILSVIASSPTDVGPVLNAIVESACELCEANDAVVLLKDGNELRYSAHYGPIPLALERRAISRSFVAGRAVVDKVPVHVRDVFAEDGAEFPEARELSRKHGIRSILSAPLLRENESIGAILLRRAEVHPFSDKQIALLRTFADQAVIAIGNVRLFDEVQAKTRDLSESLQQQTATADVLKVISRSAFNLQAVFETLVESAALLCRADKAAILRLTDSKLHVVATHGFPPQFKEFMLAHPMDLDRGSVTGRAALDRQTVQVPDILADPDFTVLESQRRGGFRTVLGVPLLREGNPIGALFLTRGVVELFTQQQIDLVTTFADQAVIAIENVRLFDEVQARTRELAASLDNLRTAQDRLVQTEKLASLGQLTAGIAHEIKNPLNFVNNFAALSAELTDELNDALKPAALSDKVREEVDELTGLLKENLQKVVQHGQRADSIVKNMLLHSREGSGDHRPADINALVDESLNLAYHGARAEKPNFNVTLQRDFDPAAGLVEVFPQEITRVFLNLVSNGFYAVTKRKNESDDGSFDPILSTTTRDLGDAVEIRIRDNGIGIPPEVKEKMFNPFFTTKPAGEGTGLGLSMSHDIIVKQHGGTIDVETAPGQFTEFRIVLPRTGNPPNKNRGQT